MRYKLFDELKTVNCEQLMTTTLKLVEFCIDGMLSTGLFILAGAPKVRKSWLALGMALSIAKEEKVLRRKSKRGTALYLCLEDSYTRIQNRLFELNLVQHGIEPRLEPVHIKIASKIIANEITPEKIISSLS